MKRSPESVIFTYFQQIKGHNPEVSGACAGMCITCVAGTDGGVGYTDGEEVGPQSPNCVLGDIRRQLTQGCTEEEWNDQLVHNRDVRVQSLVGLVHFHALDDQDLQVRTVCQAAYVEHEHVITTSTMLVT